MRTALFILLLLTTAALANEPKTGEMAKPILDVKTEPSKMMKRYLLRQVEEAEKRWHTAYEARKTPEQIADYQKKAKKYFIDSIGGFPQRTPLNAQVTGRVQKNGYSVEKIIFESQPKHFVTAAAFLPDPNKFKSPYPGVVVVCGHSKNGKACEAYQKACALMATNGLVALIVDPIEQGERGQKLDEKGKPLSFCCHGHNIIGATSIPLGRNTARFEIYDAMRAIDYLQSRPDIIRDKIACVGNSGGGTQSSYVMALDDRVAVGSPSCYICSLYRGLTHKLGCQDAEQNIFGQLAFGMDHADYAMMRAPKPTLLCTATRDFFPIDDAWKSFRMAKRLYDRFGLSERMALVETDQKHGYSKHLREGAVRWILRWLAGRDEPIVEPDDLEILTEAEIQCTPTGQVMSLEGARSVYALNRDYNRALKEQRAELWKKSSPAEIREKIRDLAAIRPTNEIKAPKVKSLGEFKIPCATVYRELFEPEPGIVLAALRFMPEKLDKTKGPVVWIDSKGKAAASDEIKKLVADGRVVLAVDLRGSGETARTGQKYFRPSFFGGDGQDWYIAYLLGRSYVGMRTEDLLGIARLFDSPVELIARGNLGVVGLHAAALEPDRFAQLTIDANLPTWSSLVDRGFGPTNLSTLVQAALTTYDLDDLARSLGPKLKRQ
jgi:cephalosporin-C deacetylase-like acetyl esterase